MAPRSIGPPNAANPALSNGCPCCGPPMLGAGVWPHPGAAAGSGVFGAMPQLAPLGTDPAFQPPGPVTGPAGCPPCGAFQGGVGCGGAKAAGALVFASAFPTTP